MIKVEDLEILGERIYTSVHSNGDQHFQRAPYIEDGWYVVRSLNSVEFELFIISPYGGEESSYGRFSSLEDAIEDAHSYS